VPALVDDAAGATQQQQRDQEVSRTTKTYWHQVIVKDFQWLRKGIASPNFQIEVLDASNNDDDISTDTIERATKLYVPRDIGESEDENSSDSDSDDEL